MRILTGKIILTTAALVFFTLLPAATSRASVMEDAFWNREWQTLDQIYSAAVPNDDSLPSFPISPREKSLYANGLWIQGRYEEGVKILEGIYQDYPDHLRVYADMLYILGLERTGFRQEAYERGQTAWGSAPDNLKFYLAYAMGRLSRDLEIEGEPVIWFRRMYESAPDRNRETTALSLIMETGGTNADEAAAMLVNSRGNARALAILVAENPIRAESLAAFALGHNAYSSGNYTEAMRQFEIASNDPDVGEDARYYAAYAAYRERRDDAAFDIWSEIVLGNNFGYPQRSVQRLEALAARSRKSDIIRTFRQAAVTRAADYPDVAADALAALIRIGDAAAAQEAEEKLFTEFHSSAQAATIRWERGWSAWKARRYMEAYEQWNAGYSPDLTNAELASRMLYWQMRALERLNSPVAAERVRARLIAAWPGEYHTFLVSADGGLRREPVPEKYLAQSDLLDWGFAVYAGLLGANITASDVTFDDVPTLYRTARLAAWDDDYPAAVRTFNVMRRVVPSEDMASSELLKPAFPRAFERDVAAASERTGVTKETIWGVMRQESLYQPDVTSSAGAYGLMQLMPATAREEARRMDIPEDSYLRPADNILLGAHHLVGLYARFREPSLVFAAYNAGGGRVRQWTQETVTDIPEWVEDIPFRETRGYVKAVLRNIQVYNLIYGE